MTMPPEWHERWLAQLGIPDCACPWGWHHMGSLYGRNLGEGRLPKRWRGRRDVTP